MSLFPPERATATHRPRTPRGRRSVIDSHRCWARSRATPQVDVTIRETEPPCRGRAGKLRMGGAFRSDRQTDERSAMRPTDAVKSTCLSRDTGIAHRLTAGHRKVTNAPPRLHRRLVCWSELHVARDLSTLVLHSPLVLHRGVWAQRLRLPTAPLSFGTTKLSKESHTETRRPRDAPHRLSEVTSRVFESSSKQGPLHLPPKEGPFLRGLERIPRQGRSRWRNPDASRLYEWDSLHGELEVYTMRGRHLGSVNPHTGALIKHAVKGRTIDV